MTKKKRDKPTDAHYVTTDAHYVTVEPIEAVEPVEPVETVETVETVEPVETVEAVEAVETVEPVETVETVEAVEAVEAVDADIIQSVDIEDAYLFDIEKDNDEDSLDLFTAVLKLENMIHGFATGNVTVYPDNPEFIIPDDLKNELEAFPFNDALIIQTHKMRHYFSDMAWVKSELSEKPDNKSHNLSDVIVEQD